MQTALYVSGGISTHHQELMSLYLQYLALLKPLLLPVVRLKPLLLPVVRLKSLLLPVVRLKPLLLPVVSVTLTTGRSNGFNNARYGRYSDMSS